MDPFSGRQDGPIFHRAWRLDQGRHQAVEASLQSPLLRLHGSSDVNPIQLEQIIDARTALRLRWRLVAGVEDGDGVPSADAVLALQRRVVERFLAGRRAYFGAEQCLPFEPMAKMAQEGRDVFVVIKFMDEAPHIEATVRSLLNQRDVDLGRLVIVAVDNNSTDGSDRIIRRVAASNRTGARFVLLNQATPGAGNAARLGVDRSIASIHAMCLHDGRWERLQTAVVAVSDGDTVYHPNVVSETLRILSESPTVDGVMPFLTYKFTAALRLFDRYVPAYPENLAASRGPAAATPVTASLTDLHAHERLPRWTRRPLGEDAMRLDVLGQGQVIVPLSGTDRYGRRFGVLRDPAGAVAYLLQDRTLVLEEAPVSGFDPALVFLENGGVRKDERWRWHALIGHDLFLYWAFAGMGLPEEMVFPDTSDALKTLRAWSFAIGGQHQLSRPDLRIATGSDYQSGRVLQAVGATVRLGPARAFAETETDRLIKMVRNIVRRQFVFYGQTRSDALERATGLYLHMTRIQAEVESELRGYDDQVFERQVFPERILFPLRWMVQNAVRFYAHPGTEAARMVRERFLGTMFPAPVAEAIERRWFAAHAEAIGEADFIERQSLAETVAQAVIAESFPAIMAFYRSTLESFFAHHRVAPRHYRWLLEGLEGVRNAIVESPPAVHPAAVWQGGEFVIDATRGQVVGIRGPGGIADPAPASAPAEGRSRSPAGG